MTINLLALALSTIVQAPGPTRVPSIDSVWYRAADEHDLTGDGIPDTLVLQATGKRVDSLLITLEIRSQARTLYRDRWLSTAYFYYDDLPIDRIQDSVKRDRVRGIFANFFHPTADYVYAPLDTTRGPAAEDSVWQGMLKDRAVTFYYSRGAEVLVGIAWSRLLGRFVQVYGCC